MHQEPKVGVQGSARCWRGVIRVNGKVVFDCGHNHSNRDNSSWRSPTSAVACAAELLRLATFPPAGMAPEVVAQCRAAFEGHPRLPKANQLRTILANAPRPLTKELAE